jgi:hypothetical protein
MIIENALQIIIVLTPPLYAVGDVTNLPFRLLQG